MLTSLHQQNLQQWMSLLLDLRSQLKQSNYILTVQSPQWQNLQTAFKQKIISLTDEGVEPQLRSPWQSFQTESHRCLRLLNTDIIFLSSSKSETTRKQRLIQINNRLDLMISYCQKLLGINT